MAKNINELPISNDPIAIQTVKIIKDEIINQIKEDLYNSQENIRGNCNWAQILPNGEYCGCDVHYYCPYHRWGERLKLLFGLTDNDIK
jgi:hypothetical protein